MKKTDSGSGILHTYAVQRSIVMTFLFLYKIWLQFATPTMEQVAPCTQVDIV